MVDIVTRLGKGSPLTNAEVDANFTNLAEVSGVTGEPMGHEDRTTSTISFNASTRTFTIAPVASSFTVWCKGKKVVVSTAQTVTIPNTTGMYSIYYDANGVLSAKSGYFTFSLEAPTAYIYWNATAGTCPYFGDERHGVVLDWQTHEYLHRTRGAALASGFAASGYVLGGNGSSNSHAQITLEGGTFFDEDMKIIVTATNTPTAGTWEQDLLSPARIPVLYLSGTGWVIDAPTDYPLKQGTSRPQYNAYSGGVWSTADVANNKYATSWILATNNLTYPVIAIIGQAENDLQSAAEAVDFTALQLPGFPSVEFRPLYKLIFQCADSCTNAVHASLVSITDIRSIAAAGTAASLVTDHGNLSGLSDDDHPQYIHVDTLRTVSAAVKASFLPSQTSNTGKFLQTDGTATSWQALTSSNVTTALGFTPYNATNPSGYISGITSGMVTTALGFTPYNATNPSGYVSAAGARGAISVTGAGSYDSATGVINIVGGVTSFNTRTGAITLSSADVTTALGFTPYNSNNPNGYLTSSALLGYLSFTGGGTVTAATTFNGGITVRDSIDGTNTVGSNFNFLTNRNGNQTLNIATADLIAGTDKYVFIGTGSASHVSSTTTVELGASTPGSITRIWSPLEIGGNTAIHAGNKDSYTYPPASHTHSYLPLSGGTLTGRLISTASANADNYAGVFRIAPSSADQWGGIAFPDTNAGTSNANNYWFYGRGSAVADRTLTAHIPSYSDYSSTGAVPSWGVYTTGATPLFRVWSNGNVAVGASTNYVLHAGNYSSYALPLTGGTLSGAVTVGNLKVGHGGYPPDANYFGLRHAGMGASSGEYMIISANASTYLSAATGQSVFIRGGGNVTTYQIEVPGTARPTVGGNTILDAGNYSSYALPLSGGTVTGQITGGLAAGSQGLDFAVNDNYASMRVIRNNSAGPNNRDGMYIGYQNSNSGLTRIFGGGSGSGGIQISGSGVNDVTIAGNTAINAGNYNSYAPTLTGTGASGTWGISISGNAATVTNGLYKVGTNAIPAVVALNTTADNWMWQWQSSGSNDWYLGPTTANFGIGGSRLAISSSGSSPNAELSIERGTTRLLEILQANLQYKSNVVLHAGNYSSYALPLTGGTMTGTLGLFGSGTNGFYAGTGDGADYTTHNFRLSGWNGMGFYNLTSGGAYPYAVSGYIDFRNGIIDMKGGFKANGSTVLHAGNYSSYALPISGGGLTGNLGVLRKRLTFSSTSGDANHSIYNNYDNIDGEGSFDGMKMNVYAGLRIRTGNGSGAVPTQIFGLDSNGIRVDGGIRQGNNLARPLATWGSTGATGMVIFKLPGSSGNYGMVHMVFDIYEYNGNSVSTVIVGGHNWASSWYNTGANVIGQCAKQVRLGYKDGQYCVVFGDASSYWEYGTIVFRKIHNGDFYNNTMDLGAAVSVQFTATESFTNIGGDLRALRTPASFNAGGAITQAGNQVLHAGNYTSYSPSLGGSGASGTWGISVTGTSRYLAHNDGPRNLSDRPPNWAARTAIFDFVVAGSGNGAGNYAGVLTFVPWDGTSGSTGDSSYQLSFANQSGVNASGPARLSIRNGINSTWNSWQEILSSSNYTSYSPSLTGSGASGTWGINVTGNAATATRAAGNFYIDSNYGRGIVGIYASTRYQGVFAMGDAYKLADDGTTTGSLYGMAWSHYNAGGAAGNLTDHGLLIINNGAFKCAISNSIVASANITAYSDERLKTNWRDMPENYVARLAQVKVGIYDRTDQEDVTQVGVSAQSFQKLLPQAIMKAKDEMGTLSVSYGNAALASAVELAKDNVELRARIERLESLINKLIGD